MKIKLFTGLMTMIMVLALMTTPVLAAILEYDEAATTTWGVNGGAGIDEYIIKLQDQGIDAETAATIETITITFEQETDYFKPQIILNSEKTGWNQMDVEFKTPGPIVYDHPVNDRFTSDSNWNELWIKSGWKNEGAVALISIEFKDVAGKIVYSVGTTDQGVIPKTGAINNSIFYGIGTLACGAFALKKKSRQ